MTPEQFTARREPLWVELEGAIRTARRGNLRAASVRDLERFGVLYRHATSDLAIARREFTDLPVTDYLNSLCARAHPLLHRGPPARLGSITAFYATGLPRRFRAEWRFMIASLALLLTGALAGWLTVVIRPDLAASIVPQSPFEALARGQHIDLGNTPLVAGVIITNNIRVAIIALVGGVTVGLVTTGMMVVNGWQLGALGAFIHQEGVDGPFWSIILPHGVIELSIIVFAGGAGLALAHAELRPGLLKRGDALAAAALRAVTLALGVAPLLIICGIIEAFVSPSDAPQAVKFGVAILTGVLLYSWLLLAGRNPRRIEPGVHLGDSAARLPDLLPLEALPPLAPMPEAVSTSGGTGA